MSTPPRPVWLDEDAEIAALLSAVLDRFDRQPGDARLRNVSLDAEKHLPSLARSDSQADQSWAFINELVRLGVLAIRAARRSPYDPEWKGAKLAFAPDSEAVLRAWLGREWIEPAMQLWRRAVHAHASAFADGGNALLARRISIAGRSPQDVVAALASIGIAGQPGTLRQLSASAFWGDSKVLDDRGDLISALFPALEVRDRTFVVAAYLPEVCNGVLFIENQDTYTGATRGVPAASGALALIYAAGFRAAGARVRSRAGALLHYAGPGVRALQSEFDAWWYEELAPAPQRSCWFWGDLDFAGMQILKALRSRFPDLTAWQPGYEPMLAALAQRGGYRSTTGESQQGGRDRSATAESQGQFDPGLTGCAYADALLLPAIRQHGQLDQEYASTL